MTQGQQGEGEHPAQGGHERRGQGGRGDLGSRAAGPDQDRGQDRAAADPVDAARAAGHQRQRDQHGYRDAAGWAVRGAVAGGRDGGQPDPQRQQEPGHHQVKDAGAGHELDADDRPCDHAGQGPGHQGQRQPPAGLVLAPVPVQRTGSGHHVVEQVGGNRYSYTAGNAKLYGSLGIGGTTYQIGFDAVGDLVGPIQERTFLDFGCGARRSTAFLKALGVGHVYGVDHDQNMIGQALSRELDGVSFLHADGPIPLPDASVDGAVSLNVFIEIRTPGEMRSACAEIARTLRPGSPFILESTSPMAFGHTFRSYSYPFTGPLRSGDTTACIVTSPDGQVLIEDTYWTEDDYTDALEHAGLTVTAIAYPRPRDPSAWSTDEGSVPPCILIKAVKGFLTLGWDLRLRTWPQHSAIRPSPSSAISRAGWPLAAAASRCAPRIAPGHTQAGWPADRAAIWTPGPSAGPAPRGSRPGWPG